MTNVKIKKAKIKDDIFLEVEYTEDLPGHTKKDAKLTSTVPVNQDLINAFAKLDKHLAILCDELELPAKVKDIDQWITEELNSFGVKGFSIGGTDDNTGCRLSGFKDGKYGTVNLNSPFQKYATSDYKHIDVLSADIEACVYEVEEYLFNGKRAPEKQLEMDFDGGDDNQNEEA